MLVARESVPTAVLWQVVVSLPKAHDPTAVFLIPVVTAVPALYPTAVFWLSVEVLKFCVNNKRFPASDGKQIRDFCYIQDAIEAIMKVIKSDKNNSFFNVGSGKGITINELVKSVQTTYGTNLPVSYDKKEVPLSSIILDISETIKQLDWKPKVNIHEGIYSLYKSQK